MSVGGFGLPFGLPAKVYCTLYSYYIQGNPVASRLQVIAWTSEDPWQNSARKGVCSAVEGPKGWLTNGRKLAIDDGDLAARIWFAKTFFFHARNLMTRTGGISSIVVSGVESNIPLPTTQVNSKRRINQHVRGLKGMLLLHDFSIDLP